MHSPIPIDSITAFVEYIEEHCPGDYALFRGQPKNENLLPPIGRDTFKPRRDLAESERRMFDEFRAVSLPFLTFAPRSPLEWLAVAQHHGMSTRLLDWTTNPLAALWFAIRGAGSNANAVDVWCLDAKKRGRVPPRVEAKPFKVQRCYVYRPPHVSDRIVRQSGWFTLHPLRPDGTFGALEADAKYADKLSRLRIPRRVFGNMRYSLDRYGAHEATFMPDLPGAAAYVDWCHRQLPDEQRTSNRSRHSSQPKGRRRLN
jgi:hypothetical protein